MQVVLPETKNASIGRIMNPILSFRFGTRKMKGNVDNTKYIEFIAPTAWEYSRLSITSIVVRPIIVVIDIKLQITDTIKAESSKVSLL